jgi:hypothetical protein
MWGNGECISKPWWIYNGSTPTLRLLGLLENCVCRVTFTPKIPARFLGPLAGSNGSTTKAASHVGRHVDFSIKHCFINMFGNFEQDFFLDPATRFFSIFQQSQGLCGYMSSSDDYIDFFSQLSWGLVSS